jgi:DUF4097 and DUF4098 domain-containing protein YvlB
MNKNFTLLFAIAFAVSASAASEEKVNRQIDVHPGGKLVVDVDFGKIDVSAGVDDKTTIEAFRSVDFGDEAKEKEYLAEVPITINAEGDTVTVRARSPKAVRRHSWHHSSMDGQYTLRVPKNFSAKLDTGGGSIAAAGLDGEMRADTGGGKLKFTHLHGAIAAETGGGSIDLDTCDGASDVETGGGDILLVNGKGILRARTGGGAIGVRNFSGDTDVRTGGGELALEKIAGRIAGETGGGSITASVSGNVVNEINLESSGGGIELTLPATAAVDINAETSSGRIKTNLPLETTRADEDHLRGKLNGGGKRVVLRTSAGSITIKSDSNETAAR